VQRSSWRVRGRQYKPKSFILESEADDKRDTEWKSGGGISIYSTANFAELLTMVRQPRGQRPIQMTWFILAHPPT
jgi:hypothetical protein